MDAVGRADLARCGTYAGYQRHVKRREEPCDGCRAAASTYMAEGRRRNPWYRARQTASAGVRSRALRRLAERHPDEFAAVGDRYRSSAARDLVKAILHEPSDETRRDLARSSARKRIAEQTVL